MAACTFFGHRECPDAVEPRLWAVLETLIVEHGVDLFYVGHQGQFDALVRRTLRTLCQTYPRIHYAVVLAYLPGPGGDPQDYADTLFPEGIETVPRRYAISWRNRWMLGRADYVVTYVTHSWGGAARFAELAKKQGKMVWNLLSMHHIGESACCEMQAHDKNDLKTE